MCRAMRVRGKHAARYAMGANRVTIDPDLPTIFPDSEAVHEALRTIARIGAAKRRPVTRNRKAG